VLPKNLGVRIELARVPVLPVFRWLAATGGIAETEMLRTFNCGVGMVVAVAPRQRDAVAAVLAREGEQVVELGEIIEVGDRGERVVYSGHLALNG
jgi:phosphoribosylformylglycinamidine cyclo-ligase